FATRDLIEAAHAAGLRVDVWTVDDPGHMAEMTGRRVDGIMTNVPERLRDVLAAGAASLPAPRRPGENSD
ncbi:MAG: glycerophosphodiester phosphodiesterase, partial [Armatimonadota bacterium]